MCFGEPEKEMYSVCMYVFYRNNTEAFKDAERQIQIVNTGYRLNKCSYICDNIINLISFHCYFFLNDNLTAVD